MSDLDMYEFAHPVNDPGTKKAPERHKDGHELLDPVPMEPPLGYRKSPTLSEQIAQQVRQMKLEVLQEALGELQETDEEADDFEVGEDFEPLSVHENDHIPSLKVLKQRAKEINEMIEKKKLEHAIKQHENAIKKPDTVTNPPGQVPADQATSSE